jgi:outer membrane protein assembly factor BamB
MGGFGLGLWVCIAASLAADPGPQTGHWAQFRGPTRDGKSTDTGLLKEWPKDGPPLAWRIDGLGTGYATVSFSADKIFTMGGRDKTQCVIAFDRSTHKEVWATPIDKEWHDGPRCTPTLDGDHAYALGAHGELACLATDTGKIIWQKSFAKDFGGKMMSDFGYSESPLIDGDKLVCTPGGLEAAVVALDKKTGRVIWQTPMPNIGPNGSDGSGYTSMVIAQPGGIRQYVQTMGRGAIGIAPDDGRLLWGYNRMTNIHAVIASPLVIGDYVFCTTAYDTGSALLEITSAPDGRSQTARELYFLGPTEFENHHGGVVLVDGYIYGGHGQNQGFPTCIELKTGRIMWKQRGPGGGSAAVTYADGNLYFRYENGVMALIEANPRELKVKSTFKLPTTRNGPSWPYPVILDGRLYLRHGDALLCYDIRAKRD